MVELIPDKKPGDADSCIDGYCHREVECDPGREVEPRSGKRTEEKKKRRFRFDIENIM